jgi:hypothetical protein
MDSLTGDDKVERITLTPRIGSGAFLGDLPLERDLDRGIVVDASALLNCHPMFAIRLRLFIDWHRAAGHAVRLIVPRDPGVAQYLADVGVGDGLPTGVADGLPDMTTTSTVLAIRRLRTWHDVEDASNAAMEMLHDQTSALAVWGEPAHMAVFELCDNALQHGRNQLGAYVAADRIAGEPSMFRLAIADLGIGIPEHIRARHPEWQDDTAAIIRALQRGVSGTGDPHRGNAFSEVFEDVNRLLAPARSAVKIEIRSAKGGILLDLVDGRIEPVPLVWNVHAAARGSRTPWRRLMTTVARATVTDRGPDHEEATWR